MKCPNCGHHQPARGGATCSKCRYRFVFNKRKDNIADNQFVQLVRGLSEDGRYAFTRTQLALVVARKRMQPGCLGGVLGLLAGGVVAALVVQMTHLPTFVAVLLGLLVGVLVAMGFYKLVPPAKTTYREALQLVDRYHRSHPLDQLATGGAFAHPGPETTVEPGYAPERVLVVEKEDLVDALIRNGFHREQRCAVVSVDGYPQHVLVACRHFVQRHPELPIYLLHDASAHGFRLQQSVEERPEWRFARGRIRDLGITREQLSAADRQRLPWLTRGGEVLEMSRRHQHMLAEHSWLPVDYAPPPMLLGALATGLVAGLLILPEPVLGGDSGGPDGGSG